MKALGGAGETVTDPERGRPRPRPSVRRRRPVPGQRPHRPHRRLPEVVQPGVARLARGLVCTSPTSLSVRRTPVWSGPRVGWGGGEGRNPQREAALRVPCLRPGSRPSGRAAAEACALMWGVCAHVGAPREFSNAAHTIARASPVRRVRKSEPSAVTRVHGFRSRFGFLLTPRRPWGRRGGRSRPGRRRSRGGVPGGGSARPSRGHRDLGRRLGWSGDYGLVTARASG